MPVACPSIAAARRVFVALASIGLLALAIDHAVAMPLPPGTASAAVQFVGVAASHLVVSEVMTGGTGASDEFIELYNPTSATLPLDGLEVVYVTATGATVTRKAAWAAGAPGLPSGAHLLIANSAGVFAGIGDATYTNGLAAVGGSVALRMQGASSAIDAVGWGTAANAWLETRSAPAPAAGSSLERLPGGSSGSSQDTDDNLVDFVIQPIPAPQNSGSSPIAIAMPTPLPTPSASSTLTPAPSVSPTTEPTVAPTVEPTSSEPPATTPSPSETVSPTPIETVTPTPSPTPTPTPTPSPSPTPVPISIGTARSRPDGSVVTVEGVTLTVSDFTDGGGYLFDATSGIAVLVSDGSFGRGQLLRVTGTVDDRYAQRTIRSSVAQITVLGTGTDPLPTDADTGSIGEAFEGSLVELTGVIASSATTLSTGIAWDLDDGSGAIRVIIGTTSGIDTAGWARGVGLTLVGVVGQRDSSGSGTTGFRVQSRDLADIIAVEPAATPSPTPEPTAVAATPSPTPTPSASASTSASAAPTQSPSATPSPGLPLVSIGQARAAATGTHLRIRGVVTAQSGLLEAGSAVVQDSTGAILLRIGGKAGSLTLGQFIELDGTRATKAGMLTLRVTKQVVRLGTQADPQPLRRATGALGEGEEARLVIARGVVSSAVSRPRGGAVSFAIDDGSGPLRVTIAASSRIATASIKRGAWLELRGVLGQVTTTKAPLHGYRLWPRLTADLRVIAAPVATVAGSTSCCSTINQISEHPAPQHPPGGGQHPDAIQGDSGGLGPGIPPTLGHPQATIAPRSPTSTSSADPATPIGRGPMPAGLIVSGMGLAAMAGLAAWFSRRRPGNGAQSLGLPPGVLESEATAPGPHLSLLRIGEEDPQEVRRILPPT